MIDFLVPRYIAEGKARVTVGIGCTGGRHRSVYVADLLYRHLAADDASRRPLIRATSGDNVAAESSHRSSGSYLALGSSVGSSS